MGVGTAQRVQIASQKTAHLSAKLVVCTSIRAQRRLKQARLYARRQSVEKFMAVGASVGPPMSRLGTLNKYQIRQKPVMVLQALSERLSKILFPTCLGLHRIYFRTGTLSGRLRMNGLSYVYSSLVAFNLRFFMK